MKPVVKDFIEQNVDLIDDNDFVALFEKADKRLSNDQIADLQEIFNEVDVDATSICWNIFETNVKTYVGYELASPYNTSSNSWARLDYMLDGISTVGFSWQEAKEHVLNNQQKLGLECRKLEPQYGWEGAGDYAFQWFNEKEFDKEFGDQYD